MMETLDLTLGDRLRAVAAARADEFFAEVPTTVRRLGLLFIALAISVPLFLVGCLAVLAWLLLT